MLRFKYCNLTSMRTEFFFHRDRSHFEFDCLMTSPLRTLNNALWYIRRNDEIVSELDLSYNVITVHEAKELAELIAHPLSRVSFIVSLRGCGIKTLVFNIQLDL